MEEYSSLSTDESDRDLFYQNRVYSKIVCHGKALEEIINKRDFSNNKYTKNTKFAGSILMTSPSPKSISLPSFL